MPVVALLLGLTGCSDDPGYDLGNDGKTGGLDPRDLVVDLSTDEEVIARSGVDTSNFLLTITDANGAVVYDKPVAESSEIITLPVGENYKVTVRSHNVENAAWSAPYYAGDKTFNIEENKITAIGTVVCKFANVRVTVNYDDKLRAMMGSDVNVVVKCSENGSQLQYGADETRSGYFKALEGSTTLGATFSGTVNGQHINLVRALNNVQAGQHRIITFKIKTGDDDVPEEMGGVTPGGEGTGVKIGNGLYLVAEVETVDVNGNVDTDDDKGDGGAVRPGDEGGDDPTPPGPGTTDYIKMTAALKFDEAQAIPDPIDGKIDITVNSDESAPNNTIQKLEVEIIPGNDDFRSVLEEMAMPLTFDLADVPADQIELFKGFKFPVNDEVKGKQSVPVDITEFVPLLTIYSGATHAFRITVTDAYGHTLSHQLIFKV